MCPPMHSMRLERGECSGVQKEMGFQEKTWAQIIGHSTGSTHGGMNLSFIPPEKPLNLAMPLVNLCY